MGDVPVGYQLKRVRLLVRHQFDATLAALGLTAASYEVLYLLERHGQASATELSKIAGVTVQTMHRQIRQVVKLGMASPLDEPGRAVRMELTPLGRERLEAANPGVMAIESDMLNGLSQAEVGELSWLLGRCEANLQDRGVD